MTLLAGNFNQQSGSDIVLGVNEALAKGELDVARPEILYPGYIPAESIDTEVNEGATDYSKLFKDFSGVASFRATGSNVVPTVGTTQGKVSIPIYSAAVSNNLDINDIRMGAMRVERGFSQDPYIRTAQILKLATEYFTERLIFFGDGIYNGSSVEFYPGLINHPLIPQADVEPGAAVGNPTEWVGKTADEIIFDIENAITSLYSTTNTVMKATDLYLPVYQFGLISSTKAGVLGNDQVILNFTSAQNISAAISGRRVNIKPLRYLDGAGVGGTDRMMVVCNDSNNYMMANPIDFRMFDIQRVGFQTQYFAESRISPIMFPWPKFAAYWDGI
jgi:hypothetical protein